MNRETLAAIIRDTVREQNARRPRPFWTEPLSAFLSARDPRLPWLKEAVSPEHLLPEDLLRGAKTVISFFIPFEERIVAGNIPGLDASREWAEAYILTNELIQTVSGELAAFLRQNRFHAGLLPATHNFDEKKLISRWSHRHIAFLAGLGSFGLNNMLITSRGCCGRFGSLLTDWEEPGPAAAVAATAADAASPAAVLPVRERCLRKSGGTCGLCQKKCPAGAYPGGVFDRRICYDRCLKNAELHRETGLADVCGKCLVGLHCSTRTPAP
jgi:epoxyqueuosine reductase QueG